ncbi:unnamed protein product [Jaminaea pallidilutea]
MSVGDGRSKAAKHAVSGHQGGNIAQLCQGAARICPRVNDCIRTEEPTAVLSRIRVRVLQTCGGGGFLRGSAVLYAATECGGRLTSRAIRRLPDKARLVYIDGIVKCLDRMRPVPQVSRALDEYLTGHYLWLLLQPALNGFEHSCLTPHAPRHVYRHVFYKGTLIAHTQHQGCRMNRFYG